MQFIIKYKYTIVYMLIFSKNLKKNKFGDYFFYL